MRTFQRNSYQAIIKPFKILDGFVLTKILSPYGYYQATGIYQKDNIVIPNFAYNCANFEFKALSEVAIEYIDSLIITPSNLEILVKFQSIARLKKASEKIDSLFEYLKENYSADNFLKFKINHDDIAELIDSTRVTVTRQLGRLEREGKISSVGKCLEFKD